MHTGCLPAGGHLVPVDDLIGNLHLTVGEGGQHREDALPEFVTTERAAGGVVTREVPSEEQVNGLDIAALHDLVERSLHDAAVGLVHGVAPRRAPLTSPSASSTRSPVSCPKGGIPSGYL